MYSLSRMLCIANMCEEGLVYSDGRDYCNRKLGPNALRSTDRLLVVGSRNADDIREYRSEFADKIAVTGNPRFDTLLSKVRCVYRRDADCTARAVRTFRPCQHELHAGQRLRGQRIPQTTNTLIICSRRDCSRALSMGSSFGATSTTTRG